MSDLTRSDVIGLARIEREHTDLRFPRFVVTKSGGATGTIVEVMSGPALDGEQTRVARWQISGGGRAERTDPPEWLGHVVGCEFNTDDGWTCEPACTAGTPKRED